MHLCGIIVCIYSIILSKNVKYKDVVISDGVVRGWVTDDGDYFAYTGIPYAAAPVGRNRFKAPSPPKPWDGIFEANRKVQCPQDGQGDEDCLIVNVFTPIESYQPLPVLVYFHGGSFLIGSSQKSGAYPLIKENIIVVTVNYRLGALGFLCLGIDQAPGNAGLKDQVAALKWVKANIMNFGGDPDQVIIYGMSAGAASIEFLILSKTSNGLYNRAIVESGSTTLSWATDFDAISTAVNVADALNFRTTNLLDLARFYQEVAVDELTKVNLECYNNQTDGYFGFVPCVENSKTEDPFITESPYNILMEQKYEKVPMMFFFSTLEGLYLRSQEYYEENYKERMEANFSDFIPVDLIFDTEEAKNVTARYIKYFYFGNRTVEDDIIGYLNYFGDAFVLQGLLNSVEFHSRDNNDVYLMEFGFKGTLGTFEEYFDYLDSAGHGDVVKYAILNKPPTDVDELTVKRVARLIANFVKYGEPTPAPCSLIPLYWPKVGSEMSYLLLKDSLHVYQKPYWARKLFWDQIYDKHRRRIEPVS